MMALEHSRGHEYDRGMRDLWDFIKAVFKFWVNLMSGIGSLGLAIWLDRSGQASVPSWIFWALGGVLFFVSFFRAWRQERFKAGLFIDVLDLFILDTKMAPGPRKCVQIIVRLEIRNTGSPTIIDSYAITVKYGNQSELTRDLTTHEEPLLLPMGDQTMPVSIKKDDCLATKTTTHPLQTGSKIGGHLCVFSSAQRESRLGMERSSCRVGTSQEKNTHANMTPS